MTLIVKLLCLIILQNVHVKTKIQKILFTIYLFVLQFICNFRMSLCGRNFSVIDVTISGNKIPATMETAFNVPTAINDTEVIGSHCDAIGCILHFQKCEMLRRMKVHLV